MEQVRCSRPETKVRATSVIIPAFNAAETLARAIRSALDQEPAPKEVLVIDDGSTDGTDLVAKSFPERVRCIGQAHLGPAAARNHGIAAAHGKYIAFLDADDYWLPGFIAASQEFLEVHTEAIAVSVGLRFIRSNGLRRAVAALPTHPQALDCAPFIIEDFFSFWGEHDHIRTGSCLIRKNVIDVAGGQRESLRIAEDLEYWAYLATFGKWGFTPGVFWVCDSERASASTGWLKKYRTRRRLCSTSAQWQTRILPRLRPNDLPGFTKTRGRVAAMLAHNLVLGGHRLKAREEVQEYGSEMPSTWSTRLMRLGNKSGWLGWHLACSLIVGRELQKAGYKTLTTSLPSALGRGLHRPARTPASARGAPSAELMRCV